MKAKITILLIISVLQLHAQTYFDLTKEADYRCQWDNSMPLSSDLKKMKVYNANEVTEIFNTVTNSGVEFHYPQGGCQHRAHIMSLILKKKKIEHAKIWLFAPVDLFFNNTQAFYINDENKFSGNGIINWNYHVATVILSNENGATDTLVIDPSINRNKALKVQDWFAEIGNHEKGKYTYLDPEQYFFYVKYFPNTNSLSSVISGCFYKYEGDTAKYLTLEKGLALNDMSMQIYDKYIKNFLNDSSKAATISDLKLIFGNATTSDLIFVAGNTPNANLLAAIQRNQQIVDEAKTTFASRLQFWKNYVSTN